MTATLKYKYNKQYINKAGETVVYTYYVDYKPSQGVYTVLEPTDVDAIKERHKLGVTKKRLCADYNISYKRLISILTTEYTKPSMQFKLLEKDKSSTISI